MQILQRKELEAISVFTEQGEEIRIVVLKSNNGRVHLGINTPEGMAVLREELISPDVTD